MKKLIALLLALVMCVSFSACGGDKAADDKKTPETTAPKATEPKATEPEETEPAVDKQTAVNALNEAAIKYNTVATFMNENLDLFTEEEIGIMNAVGEQFTSYQTALEPETVDADVIQEIIEWSAQASSTLDEFITSKDIFFSEGGDISETMQVAQDAMTEAALAYNDIAIAINDNPDQFPEEAITFMNGLEETIVELQEKLDSGTMSEEELNSLIDWCAALMDQLNAIKEANGIE